MHASIFFAPVAATLCLATLAGAQTPGETDLEPSLALGGNFTGMVSAGNVVKGPIDIQAVTANNVLLGVEYAWGHFWVSGSQPGKKHIYKITQKGVLAGSWPQHTAGGPFNHRDLEADEVGGRLFAGEGGGRIVAYSFDPPSGGVVFDQEYVLPALGVVRALARNPANGHFFTADFAGPIFEFDLSGTIHNTFANPGKFIYGAAWNPLANTLWIWSQDAPTGSSNFVEATELDPATMTPTGRAFYGAELASQSIAGGSDVYFDWRNPGRLSLVGLHQGAQDALVIYDVDQPIDSPMTYCVGKVNSQGCLPLLDWSGTPSASDPNPFTISVSEAINGKVGLNCYSFRPGSVSFQDSVLCVHAPIKRGIMLNTSGGNSGPEDCSGTYAANFNCLIPGNPQTCPKPKDPALAVGSIVYLQYWMRDPRSPSTTGLSNAIAFPIAP